MRINFAGTSLFVVSAIYSAAVFTSGARMVGVIVSLVLFMIGVATFIWGYFTAVQRSRQDEISVATLFFLNGGVADSRISRAMNGCLGLQVVTALGTAISRTSTEGRSGSTLAFGVLVPLFGIGLNGLWASKNGKFSSRKSPDTFTSSTEIGNDIGHG